VIKGKCLDSGLGVFLYSDYLYETSQSFLFDQTGRDSGKGLGCLLYSSFYIATFTGVGFKTFFKSSGEISASSPLFPALI
jgi:hypothetical protein